MRNLIDLVGLAGFGLIVAGIQQIYTPAALIFAGLAMATAAILAARKPTRNDKPNE